MILQAGARLGPYASWRFSGARAGRLPSPAELAV